MDVKWNKLGSEKYHIFSHMWNLDLRKKHECKRGVVWGTETSGKEEGETEADRRVNIIKVLFALHGNGIMKPIKIVLKKVMKE
jgi:hypothetical protein